MGFWQHMWPRKHTWDVGIGSDIRLDLFPVCSRRVWSHQRGSQSSSSTSQALLWNVLTVFMRCMFIGQHWDIKKNKKILHTCVRLHPYQNMNNLLQNRMWPLYNIRIKIQSVLLSWTLPEGISFSWNSSCSRANWHFYITLLHKE